MEKDSAPFYRVFGVYELAHMVLNHLRGSDLLQVAKTSRLLNTYINGIRERHTASASQVFTPQQQTGKKPVLNPLADLCLVRTSRLKDQDDSDPTGPFMLPVSFLMSPLKDTRSGTALRLDGKPWNMFVTSPPVTEIFVYLRGTGLLLPGCRKPTTWYYFCGKHGTRPICNPNGVTFGDVAKTICGVYSRERILFKMVLVSEHAPNTHSPDAKKNPPEQLAISKRLLKELEDIDEELFSRHEAVWASYQGPKTPNTSQYRPY